MPIEAGVALQSASLLRDQRRCGDKSVGSFENRRRVVTRVGSRRSPPWSSPLAGRESFIASVSGQPSDLGITPPPVRGNSGEKE